MTRDASRPRRNLPALATLTAVAAVTISGCSWMSPVQTNEPYVPGDGIDATLQDVKVTNLLVVAADKGAPGVVVGQVTNDGNQEVELTIAGPSGAGSVVKKVPANGVLNLQQAGVTLPATAAAPGGMEQIMLSTPTAGQHPTTVPVLPNTGIYATISPSAAASSGAGESTPAPAASETPSASATPSQH